LDRCYWPFAYFDIYDYAIWGKRFGAPFWGYGYDDIYAGMFAPYAYDDLAGYLPPRVAAPGTLQCSARRLRKCAVTTGRDIAACRLIGYCKLLSRRDAACRTRTNSPCIGDGAQTISACPTRLW